MMYNIIGREYPEYAPTSEKQDWLDSRVNRLGKWFRLVFDARFVPFAFVDLRPYAETIHLMRENDCLEDRLVWPFLRAGDPKGVVVNDAVLSYIHLLARKKIPMDKKDMDDLEFNIEETDRLYEEILFYQKQILGNVIPIPMRTEETCIDFIQKRKDYLGKHIERWEKRIMVLYAHMKNTQQTDIYEKIAKIEREGVSGAREADLTSLSRETGALRRKPGNSPLARQKLKKSRY